MSRNAIFFLLFVAPALSLILGVLGLKTLQGNLMGWFLLATGIAYPASVLASYWIRKTPLWGSQGESTYEEKGDRSFWMILPGMIAAFLVPPLEYMYMVHTLPRSEAGEITGMVLAFSGIVLGFWARFTNKAYSGHLHATASQKLITSGPYHLVRHPGYAGFFLAVLGVAIGYGSLLGLAVIALLVLPSLAYRIKVEENILEQEFGNQYSDYKRRVKKIIPGIW